MLLILFAKLYMTSVFKIFGGCLVYLLCGSDDENGPFKILVFIGVLSWPPLILVSGVSQPLALGFVGSEFLWCR